MTERFTAFAAACARAAGSPYVFAMTVGLIVAWAVSGPFAGWSDTWQLVANTATTIATTLLVLLVQHTQNRDALAIHAKLDDIISSQPGSNRMMGAEELSLDELRAELDSRRAEAKEDES